MPVRFLSDAQREQLSGFPAELEPESLDRFFTLSGPDLAEVRRRHGDENRLGWSLQLCGLRMLGFCPDDVTTAPPSAVRFVARQLGVDPGVLDGYGSRAQTRTDHVNQVKAHLGFCSATNADLQDARDWLAAEALVQDRPVVLFRLVCERLHELRLVRPGLSVIEQSLVGAAREAARKETAARVAHLATPERCRSPGGSCRSALSWGRPGRPGCAGWRCRHRRQPCTTRWTRSFSCVAWVPGSGTWGHSRPSGWRPWPAGPRRHRTRPWPSPPPSVATRHCWPSGLSAWPG